LLEVSRLRRGFGNVQAVKDVSFEVHAGETYGLLGPNGAGKTTSISMIAGILKKDGGTVMLDGRAVDTRAVDGRNGIGLVPQELALYPDLTGRENLDFFGRLYSLGGAELRARGNEVLEMVGLSDRANQLVREYSGGMKRRLNIAAGLIHTPKLLILDEPTVGVDPQSRNAIMESVEQLARRGMAVLYTTHYMEEAERLCDRIGIMDEGRLVAEGTKGELAAIIGGDDVVRVTAEGDLQAGAEGLRNVSGVARVDVLEGGFQVTANGAARLLAKFMHVLDERGLTVSSIDVTEPDLEAVFLRLTGKALRD